MFASMLTLACFDFFVPQIEIPLLENVSQDDQFRRQGSSWLGKLIVLFKNVECTKKNKDGLDFIHPPFSNSLQVNSLKLSDREMSMDDLHDGAVLLDIVCML